MKRYSTFAVALLLIALVAGCGSSDDSGDTGTSGTTGASGAEGDQMETVARPRAMPHQAAALVFGEKLRKVDVSGDEASTKVSITFVAPSDASVAEIEKDLINGYTVYFETAKPPAFVKITAEKNQGDGSAKRIWATSMTRSVGEEVDWSKPKQTDFEKTWKTLYKQPGL